MLGGLDAACYGLQDVVAGEPALKVPAVVGDDREAVTAVLLQLAQGLGKGLGGEQGVTGHTRALLDLCLGRLTLCRSCESFTGTAGAV